MQLVIHLFNDERLNILPRLPSIIYKEIKAMGSYVGVLLIPRPRALACSDPGLQKGVRLLFLQ